VHERRRFGSKRVRAVVDEGARLVQDRSGRVLVRRGLAQAARFSWEKTAAAHVALYRRLAGR